jgi:uncharacterized membrane protein YheB (UPF0754 family)
MFNFQSFIIAPVIGAVIGYITNWLAIRMLFRPHQEKRVFGIRVPLTPGLIPKERNRLTIKVAETVGSKLLTQDVLIKEMASEKTQNAVNRLLDEAVSSLKANDTALRDVITGFIPDPENILGALIKPGGKLSELLPDETISTALDYIHGKLPDLARILVGITDDNPGMDGELSKLIERVINENLGRFIGFFLDPEKIAKSLKLEFSIFISNPENHSLLIQKLRDYADSLLEHDAAEAEDFLKRLLLTNSVLDMTVAEIFERLGEDNLNGLKAFVMKWINKGVYKAAEFAARNMNVKGMVEDKMNSFALDEAEEIILSVVHRELTAITMVGGVLGFIIGLTPGVISLF